MMIGERHLAGAAALFGRLTGEFDTDIRIIAQILLNYEIYGLRNLRHELAGPQWAGSESSWDYAIAQVRKRIRELTNT